MSDEPDAVWTRMRGAEWMLARIMDVQDLEKMGRVVEAVMGHLQKEFPDPEEGEVAMRVLMAAGLIVDYARQECFANEDACRFLFSLFLNMLDGVRSGKQIVLAPLPDDVPTMVTPGSTSNN